MNSLSELKWLTDTERYIFEGICPDYIFTKFWESLTDKEKQRFKENQMKRRK